MFYKINNEVVIQKEKKRTVTVVLQTCQLSRSGQNLKFHTKRIKERQTNDFYIKYVLDLGLKQPRVSIMKYDACKKNNENF